MSLALAAVSAAYAAVDDRRWVLVPLPPEVQDGTLLHTAVTQRVSTKSPQSWAVTDADGPKPDETSAEAVLRCALLLTCFLCDLCVSSFPSPTPMFPYASILCITLVPWSIVSLSFLSLVKTCFFLARDHGFM